MSYGMHYPHLNGRSANIFESVRQAAAAGMRAIGLMDNFMNSSGYAALAAAELGHLGIEIFGGLIMQPTAGGVTYEAARNAVDYGYGPGTGARFLSLPTHHTKAVARREGRTGLYLEAAFGVHESGKVPDPVPAIIDLCAERDIVFDCGHVDGWEAVALAEEAKKRGATRVRTHAGGYDTKTIETLVGLGAYCEFSFFVLTHATQVGLTHVDQEKHRAPSKTVQDLTPRIRAAGDRAIVSGRGVPGVPRPARIGRFRRGRAAPDEQHESGGSVPDRQLHRLSPRHEKARVQPVPDAGPMIPRAVRSALTSSCRPARTA